MTLGDVREEIARAEMSAHNPIPPGMSKADYAEWKFNSCLMEEDDFDLLVMGRTQGKGCYCFVNGLLQAQLMKRQDQYPYMVVDNEAGMEHISRGILPSMQTCILVSDCSRRGVQAVGRIAELIRECEHMIDEVVMEPRESQFVDKPHDDVGQPPEIHGGDKSHTFILA